VRERGLVKVNGRKPSPEEGESRRTSQFFRTASGESRWGEADGRGARGLDLKGTPSKISRLQIENLKSKSLGGTEPNKEL